MGKTVFFDLETTGLSPWKNEIVQIAAVVVDDKTMKELATYEQKVAFCVEDANPEALKVINWEARKEEWDRRAVHRYKAVWSFKDFLKKHATVRKTSKKGHEYKVAQMAGHNAAGFDMPFISAAFKKEREFFPGDYHCIDTMVMAQVCRWLGKLRTRDLKLETLYKELTGERLEGAHDALADVRATVEIARRMKELLS